MKTMNFWLLCVVLLVTFLVPARANAQQENAQLVEWVEKVMLSIQPPEKSLTAGGETEAELRARYRSIAVDLSSVANASSIYNGVKGPYQTAALMLAIAYHESHFTKGVDSGKVKGDGGKSVCLMQINLGPYHVGVGDEEMQSWYAKNLIEDRTKCFRVALTMIKTSMSACKKYDGTADVLSVYTSGQCRKDEPEAGKRWKMAKTILEKNAVPATGA